MAEIPRRHFLKAAASLAALDGAGAFFRSHAAESTVLAYVGTYSDHGEGIYLFRQDAGS